MRRASHYEITLHPIRSLQMTYTHFLLHALLYFDTLFSSHILISVKVARPCWAKRRSDACAGNKGTSLLVGVRTRFDQLSSRTTTAQLENKKKNILG